MDASMVIKQNELLRYPHLRPVGSDPSRRDGKTGSQPTIRCTVSGHLKSEKVNTY